MLLRDDSYFEWIVVYVLMISFSVFVSIQNSPDWDTGGVRVTTSCSGNSFDRSPVL